MSSVRYGLLTVAACAFLLLIACAAVVISIHRTNELADSQEYVGDKLFGARQVYETLMSMESSQRGYLLTGNDTYLEPYRRGSAEIDGTISNFEWLYRDDAEARAMVADIHRLARAMEDELSQTVALASSGKRDAALEIVNGNEGKQVMDQLRTQLLTLVAQQRAKRTWFVDHGRETLRHLYLLGAIIGALIMTLVAAAVRSLSVSIARLNAAQKAEEHNAMHDTLTGLPNRRYLSEWMTTALAAARRAGRELHVLYFDLDGFKAVNDRFGHEAGDEVLKITGARLRDALRSSDFVARLGGDEFVAVLPQTDEPPDVGALVVRLEQQLNRAPLDALPDGVVTASIGRAAFPRDGDTVTALLAAADRSMYNIKEIRRIDRADGGRQRPGRGRLGQHQPA